MQAQLSEHANLDGYELFHRGIGERVAQVIETDDVVTPEQIILDELDRNELWQVASGVAQSEPERVVLIESYVYALPPQVILARHPDLFADVTAIYATKRNLLDRLQRCREMWLWYQGWHTT